MHNLVQRTAYLRFCIDTDTGEIIGAGIFSEDSPSVLRPRTWMAPTTPAEASGTDYEEATSALRKLLAEQLRGWWGKPGSPIYDAIKELVDGASRAWISPRHSA